MTKETLDYAIKATEEFTKLFDEAEAKLREHVNDENTNAGGVCGTGTEDKRN